MKITPKAKLLVSAWDAVDAGQPLTPDQQYALDEHAFISSTAGLIEAEQALDQQVLRTAVRMSSAGSND